MVLNNINSILQIITSELESDCDKNKYMLNVNDLIGVKLENDQTEHEIKWFQEYKD